MTMKDTSQDVTLESTIRYLRSEPDVRWYHLAFVFTVSAAVLFVRKPDLLLNAQFWAEDATLWFHQAYSLPWWRPFIMPGAGYLQTVSRLAALAAQFLPMLYAPLLFNLIAVAVRAAVVTFVFSSRCRRVVPGIGAKILVALTYLALPSMVEVYANLTNAHWHLALLAFLIVVAEPARTIFGRLADLFVLLLSALSGPFVFMLLPVAVLRPLVWSGWRRPDVLLAWGVLGAGTMLQSYFLFVAGAVGIRTALPEFSLPLLLQVFGAKLVVAPALGLRGSLWLDAVVSAAGGAARSALYVVGGLVGLAAVAAASLRHRPLALYALFSFLIFAAAVYRPVVGTLDGIHAWEAMSLQGVGNRYFTLPSLAVMLCVLHLALSRTSFRFRGVALALSAIMVGGMVSMWILKPWPDLLYPEHVARCEATEPGGTCVVPVLPQYWDPLVFIKE